MLQIVKKDDALSDEGGRLCALRRYDVLDTEPEPGFEKITNLVQSIFDVPIAAVSLIDSERQWFKSIQGLDATETPRSVSFCTHTIKERECVVVADARQDARFADNPLVSGPPFIRAYAGAPLETPEGYNVGALCVIDQKPRDFDDGQLFVLKNFAKLVVEKLELRQDAARDPLTKFLTRRAFGNAISGVAERTASGKGKASLAVFDLDHFKHVNDTWGHPAGDAVLAAVASACREVKRPEDVIGRLGGEEFAVLMPGVAGEAAMGIADRMRAAIEAAIAPDWPHISFTASFGVADVDPDAASTSLWMASADAALYRAKRSGRNCVAN